MAITVKDNMGGTENVSSNGKGNLGVTLGAIGTGLGILNGGLGLFGGVNPMVANGAVPCPVNETKYYEDRIQDIKDLNCMMMGVQNEICNLKERTSVNETANQYQNMLNAQAFGYVDNRFANERLLTGYEIQARTCDFIKATKVITPSQLGTTYANPTMALNQHQVRTGYCDGPAVIDDGCGCGCAGYRGF